MAIVTARLKVRNKHFEILVDLDEALKVKAGKGNVTAALQSPHGHIYHDVKKGFSAPQADLEIAFGTTDIFTIAQKIIVSGEVQKTQEFRDNEREARIKQLVHLIIKNAVDQHGRPYTEERIKRALDEAHYNLDSRPAEQHITSAVEALKKVIPIKLETKRIRLVIPAQYTGQVYALLKDYKESEEWMPNGSLQAILNIPAGLQIDFYDKLNGITHGAVQSEELAEKK